MASYKDTFESHTFLANTFASGAWRGAGVTATGIVLPPTTTYNGHRTWAGREAVLGTFAARHTVMATHTGKVGLS